MAYNKLFLEKLDFHSICRKKFELLKIDLYGFGSKETKGNDRYMILQ